MGLFNFIETFFFISLGITFILILLLVYHFKQRLSNLEQKNDSMVSIINNIVKEMTIVKQISNMFLCNRTAPTTTPFLYKDVNNNFNEKENEEDEDYDSDYASDDEDDEGEGDEDEEKNSFLDSIISSDPLIEIIEEIKNEVQHTSLVVEDESSPEITEVREDESSPEITEVTENIEVSESIILGDIEPLGKNDNVTTDETYKKMSIPELRTLVVTKGLTKDSSKMKKPDLFKLLQLQL